VIPVANAVNLSAFLDANVEPRTLDMES